MSRLLGGKAKITNNEDNISLSDGDLSIDIIHPHRALMYRDGIKKRYTNILNEYMVERVDLKSGDTIVDCGANIGEFTLAVSCLADERDISNLRLVAFEPSPREFLTLERNVQNLSAPDAVLSQIALGERTDDATCFYLKSDTADNSVIEPLHYTEKITIKSKRLDDCEIDGPTKMLKVEAEGLEPEILRGALNTLKNTSYVTVDCGFERGINSETTLPDVTNILLGQGFELLDVTLPRLIALYGRKK